MKKTTDYNFTDKLHFRMLMQAYEHLYSPKYGRQKTEKRCTTDDKIQAK